MGRLLVRLKVFPSDVDIDLNGLKMSIVSNLPQGAFIKGHSEEPIAFGLKALILDVDIDEHDGAVDSIEGAIAASDNINSVQILGVSRSSTTFRLG